MLPNWRGARSRVERQAVVLDRVFGTPKRTLSHAAAQTLAWKPALRPDWPFATVLKPVDQRRRTSARWDR
jgi:hypothetical protein